MKKFLGIIIAALLLGAILSMLYACDSPGDVNEDPQIQYSKIGKTLILTKYEKNESSFVIPEGVTAIGEYAFMNCTNLVNVTIPDTVTTIHRNAFYGCAALTEIVIPDSVTAISGGAFWECASLTSMVIPESVTSLDTTALFYGCTNLKSAVLPSSLTRLGYGTFEKCAALTEITVPAGVTSIEASAFKDCTSLESATFASTDGWWQSEHPDATSGADIPSADLADPAKAAECLKSTYIHSYWTRD